MIVQYFMIAIADSNLVIGKSSYCTGLYEGTAIINKGPLFGMPESPVFQKCICALGQSY